MRQELLQIGVGYLLEREAIDNTNQGNLMTKRDRYYKKRKVLLQSWGPGFYKEGQVIYINIRKLLLQNVAILLPSGQVL